MILDGVGINKSSFGNAVKLAKTPNLDKLYKKYPNSHLQASGLAVGLPDGQMGNSEVGHTNIGAGRIIYQDLTRINKDIDDGYFEKNQVILKAIENAKNGHCLHIMGLVSDGGVHSHQDHLFALLKIAKKHNVNNVYIHAFTDGRDVPPTSAVDYIKKLQEKITEIGIGKIATVCGRYYSMDRDNRWDRTELAYNALTSGIGIISKSAIDAIKESYKNNITDEFIKPIIIVDDNNQPISKISDNDSVIFFNFRSDRPRQISHAMTDKTFSNFNRKVKLNNLQFVSMTEYDTSLKSIDVAYKPQDLSNTFGEYISKNGYSQLRIAETEKYAHVTFFFNGGEEKEFKNEHRILVPSPKVATYDLKPEMSAFELTEKVIDSINSKLYDVIILNYANGDLLGHTGMLDKAIIAVEAVDKCLRKVIEVINKVDGEAIITADHGNCEIMIDSITKEPCTSHTTSEVPIIIVSDRVKTISSGKLCDIAPTLLDLMGERKPIEITGESIISL